MRKIWLRDTGIFKKGGWYFQATVGPFTSQQEAYDFARKAAIPEGEQAEAPPALGINVSETITAKDKFG